jgi:hypothetical protein
MMRVAVVAFGAVTIGLGVAIVRFFEPGRQSIEESKPVVHRARALRSELRHPASRSPEPAETTANVPQPTAESALDSARSAPVKAATLPGQTSVTPLAQAIEQMPRSSTEGERVFSAEPVDATWAPGAEADILGRFARVDGLALIGLQVECKSTMCRLQVASPKSSSGGGPDLFDFFNNSLGLKPRWVRVADDGSGMMQWVAYVGREGWAPNAADSVSAPAR